ncbi:MAG: c-type cytochrome [Acidimicrobiia bacterium]|jgi:cytochrome c551/c552
MRRRSVFGLTIVFALVLAACGGGGDGGGLDGEELFSQTVLEGQAGCVTCHSLSPDQVLVGPSLATIGSEAGSRVEGLDAEGYIRQSIVDPGAHVVEGFADNLMPTWGEILSDSQVSALVDYLLTLRG